MQQRPTAQLAGHFDEVTAYAVHNYPYAFGQFCTIRYWVETRKAYGQRLMTQIRNPATGEWFKAKTDGYRDVAIITVFSDVNDLHRGFVHPVVLDLDKLTVEQLNQFSAAFTLTPFQKERVMQALERHGERRAPAWGNFIELNMRATEQAENPQKLVGIRMTDEIGIPIESQYDADRRANKERRQAQPANIAKAEAVDERKYITIAGERTDVTGMSEQQIEMMIELNS